MGQVWKPDPATSLRELALQLRTSPTVAAEKKRTPGPDPRDLALLSIARHLRPDLSREACLGWVYDTLVRFAAEVPQPTVWRAWQRLHSHPQEELTLLQDASHQMGGAGLLSSEDLRQLGSRSGRVLRIETARVSVPLSKANAAFFGACQRCALTGSFRPQAQAVALVEVGTGRPLGAALGRLSDGVDELLLPLLSTAPLAGSTLLWAMDHPMPRVWDRVLSRGASVHVLASRHLSIQMLRDLSQGGYAALVPGLSTQGVPLVHVVEHRYNQGAATGRKRQTAIFSAEIRDPDVLRHRLGLLQTHLALRWHLTDVAARVDTAPPLRSTRPHNLRIEVQARVCIDAAAAWLAWQTLSSPQRQALLDVQAEKATVLARRWSRAPRSPGPPSDATLATAAPKPLLYLRGGQLTSGQSPRADERANTQAESTQE
ncbi:hypothetical protein KAK07_22685 [Ideonella sp. 4Y16]|uniref:Uncharacterized protein n=1 Tax=Ideonella aquatica TaxID=2824119 RepID=A0A940YHW2_9BURK|nr:MULTISPECIES: hypothetical protein [Ideonella]MBQ0946166.1 hypothetical protein [Ideonella alba]MBQ0960410.1 hypothetical protein [Ideonella aquatica]